LNLKNIIKNKYYKYKDTPFTLTSGKESNHYFDLRPLLNNPKELGMVTYHFCKEVVKYDIDCIGGMETGAIPLCTATALTLYYNKIMFLNTFFIRKKAKEHGTKSLIEGRGTRGIVIDDVLTTGGSIKKSIDIAHKYGIDIVAALVIIDRQECEIKLPNLFSIFKKEDFL